MNFFERGAEHPFQKKFIPGLSNAFIFCKTQSGVKAKFYSNWNFELFLNLAPERGAPSATLGVWVSTTLRAVETHTPRKVQNMSNGVSGACPKIS